MVAHPTEDDKKETRMTKGKTLFCVLVILGDSRGSLHSRKAILLRRMTKRKHDKNPDRKYHKHEDTG